MGLVNENKWSEKANVKENFKEMCKDLSRKIFYVKNKVLLVLATINRKYIEKWRTLNLLLRVGILYVIKLVFVDKAS